MSAEVAGMGTNSSASGATSWCSSAVPTRLPLLLSTQRVRQREAALHLQVEGRTIRDTGDTNKKMMPNHLL